ERTDRFVGGGGGRAASGHIGRRGPPGEYTRDQRGDEGQEPASALGCDAFFLASGRPSGNIPTGWGGARVGCGGERSSSPSWRSSEWPRAREGGATTIGCARSRSSSRPRRGGSSSSSAHSSADRVGSLRSRRAPASPLAVRVTALRLRRRR